MRNSTLLQWLSLGSLLLLISSCASISGFQTGRTVGAETGEIMFSVNGTRSPDFDELSDENVDSLDSEDFNIFFPNLEIGGRYGVSEKLDFGIRANTNLNLFADVKYQLVGDQESPVALATGFGLGMFGVVSGSGGLFNFQIPLYASYHPTESLDLYVSPRYVGQWGTAFGESSGLINYFGANAGFLAGRRTKFGVDIAYYGLNNSKTGFDSSLFQIGFGMKFKIGGGRGDY
ncbi:MAG: hypothetical protein ACK4TA_23880 [Saprospiraceae bacterium]